MGVGRQESSGSSGARTSVSLVGFEGTLEERRRSWGRGVAPRGRGVRHYESWGYYFVVVDTRNFSVGTSSRWVWGFSLTSPPAPQPHVPPSVLVEKFRRSIKFIRRVKVSVPKFLIPTPPLRGISPYDHSFIQARLGPKHLVVSL